MIVKWFTEKAAHVLVLCVHTETELTYQEIIDRLIEQGPTPKHHLVL